MEQVAGDLHAPNTRQEEMACERGFERHVLARRGERVQPVERNASSLDLRDASFLLDYVRIDELGNLSRSGQDLASRSRFTRAVRSGDHEEVRHRRYFPLRSVF